MTASRRPDCVVITGLGAVSPVGVGMAAFVAGLRAGRSGVRLLEGLDERARTTAAAVCDGFDPLGVMSEAEAARVPRMVPMALAAAREAMEQAGMAWGGGTGAESSRRIGLVLGTGGGGIDFTLAQSRRVHWGGGRPSLWTLTNATHGNLAGELSIGLGLRGPSLCVSTGCASSSDAFGHAMDLLRVERPGAPDAVVVVGADAHVDPDVLASMELLRVISTRDWRGDPMGAGTASRPFDRTRDGFVLGEGAWAAVLERPAHARARGASTLGEALGYGATCDAYHRVRPDPEMTECVRAMRLAIEDAGLSPEDIGAVQYHGTATKVNDAQEVRAVRAAFGPHAEHLVGSSVKGMLGHPQGACGMASVAAMLGSFAALDGDVAGPFMPPTINLHEQDPVCDLDFTALEARPMTAPTFLVNCLAFGAKNSALVLRVPGG